MDDLDRDVAFAFFLSTAIHVLLHKKFLRRAETSGAVVKFARCQQDK